MSSKRPASHQESGVILIISLVFLALVSILGASAVSTVLLQERISGNYRDTNMAFQAAQAAMAEGERCLKSARCNPTTTPLTMNTGIAGLGYDPGSRIQWKHFDWASQGTPVTANLDGVRRKGYFVIEKLNNPPPTSGDPTIYRITSYGVGSSVDGGSILQATYVR